MKQLGFSSSPGDYFQDTPVRKANQTNPLGAKRCIFAPATQKFFAIQQMKRKNTRRYFMRKRNPHRKQYDNKLSSNDASYATMFLYARIPHSRVILQ